MNQNFYGLITQERADKFDLLGQLVLNQRETIIFCGDEGIGKTTLLNGFKKTRENIWIICLLKGEETLDFDKIQSQLISTIQQYDPELANHDLQSALRFCEQQQRKAVLIIDDATYLAAGLIATLIEYALNSPILRMVFTFTREQLYQKSKTDRMVDDCYFMELTALTKSQTTVFVQDSALFHNQNTVIQAIDNKLLNKLYQRTAGVPGKILTELPLLIESEQKKLANPLLKTTLISGVIAISAVFFLMYKTNEQAGLASLQFSAAFDSLPQKPVKLAIKQNAQAIVQQNNKNVSPENLKQAIKLEKTMPPTSNQSIQQEAGEQWVLQQAPEKYTLQLIASPNRQALLDIAKQHKNLEPTLKILRLEHRNQENNVLLYGSFADTKTAYLAVNSLPAEFKQAWPRQFNSLQREITNRAVLLSKTNQLPSKK